jgi:hypothetical protein
VTDRALGACALDFSVCYQKESGFMPRELRLDPIKAADLSEYLSESDFGFELEIFRLCQSGGFSAEHGGTYQDPVTKKDRQFDIRLRIAKGPLVIRLAVECKNLRSNFPLLVSRVPRLTDESFHNVLVCEPPYGPVAIIPQTTNVRVIGPGTLYRPNELVGKATAQIGRRANGELWTGDTEVHDKWTQAISSAFGLVKRSEREYEETGESVAAVIVLPLLVVPDNTLWTADYSADGTLLGEPHPTTESLLYLDKSVFTGPPFGVAYDISHLHILTKSKLDGFLNRIAVNDKFWRTHLFPLEFLAKHLPHVL